MIHMGKPLFCIFNRGIPENAHTCLQFPATKGSSMLASSTINYEVFACNPHGLLSHLNQHTVSVHRGETPRADALDSGHSLPLRHRVLRHGLWRGLDPHHRAVFPDHVDGADPESGRLHHGACRCRQD